MGLSLKLLGEFAVRDEAGKALSLPTRKTRALLAYLAVNANKSQPRERLTALLWSDRGEHQARQSLNQALRSIRKLGEYGGALLVSDGERVTLDGAAVDCDVLRLRALAKDQPAEAAVLYDGPFLDGLSIPDPAFEEWLRATQSELRTLACAAQELAAATAEERGDVDEAIAQARRLVALDPLREDGHRRLMRLLHRAGDRSGALQQYQVCKDILERELQTDPEAESQALFAKIRGDTELNAKTRTPAAREALVLPDKPSIAVLAFDNMSGDVDQSFFAHAMAEDIITRLAQRHDMEVAARMSSFTYKDKSVTAQQIGSELGVRYLLEGSVQTAAEDIRITVQLIEATTGKHIWARSYDRKLKDLFAVQDEIARDVAIELAVNLTEGEMARYHSEGTDNLEAYNYFLRGRAAFLLARKEAVTQAGRMFEKAIEIDPQYSRAIAWLGFVRYMQKFQGWADDPERALHEAEQLARRAIAIDKRSAYGHAVLSKVHLFRREYDEAIAAGKRAIEIEPGNAAHYGMLAHTSIIAGQLDEASELAQEMLRLAPRPPVQVLSNESWAHYLSGRYEETIAACQKLLAQSTETESSASCYRKMIASYVALGRELDARAVARIHMEKFPGFSLLRRANVLKSRPYKDPSWIDIHIDRLRRAGLPD